MKDQSGVTRREFMKLAIASGAAVAAGSRVWAEDAPATKPVPTRVLGRTGEKISCMGVGGYHIGNPDEETGIRIIRTAIDNGITFMDNCWDYHGGGSETRMGKALRDGYRNKAFLMSKIDGRTAKAAAQQIEESLIRLQTDHVDLMQFHEIIRLEDPDRIFAPGGSMEAMLEAKKAGKVRYIGFTGHKDPLVHIRMLEVAAAHGFRFDAVQMPLNVMDAHFRSFEKQVLPLLLKDEIGVLAMKPLCAGRLARSQMISPVESLRYVLNLPVSTVITGIDTLPILDQALDVARNFKPMDPEAVASLLARSAEAGARGDFEGFKTTNFFDGTGFHPEWMG